MTTHPTPTAPLDGEWITWTGGENPVPGQRVDVRYRASEGERGPSDGFSWSVIGGPHDIIAYRLARPTPAGNERRLSDPVSPLTSNLHKDTAYLVNSFAVALAHKLLDAQRKYGYSNGWLTDDWEAKCKADLLDHVHKGDPLDVAAYAAFCWARNWPTTTPAQPEPGAGELECNHYLTLADLHTIKGWLHGLATAPDLSDVVADGGVSVGDCYQQEAREFAGRLERAITDHTQAQAKIALLEGEVAELRADRDVWVDRTDAALDLQENERKARLSAEADAALFKALRDESWDLRCFNMPTGGDDYDIGWRVVGHWQAEPRERTIAEVFTDDPAEAVRQALAAQTERSLSDLKAEAGR